MERSLTGKGIELERNGPWDMLGIIIDEGLIKMIRNWKYPLPDHLSGPCAFDMGGIQAMENDLSLLIMVF
jgi:hypothetical protein